MDLLLKVIDGPSDGGWRGLEARFDRSGGLIGRAETARLSLPDSSRTVSRFHAHVSCSDDAFFLEEMGSRNVATINGKAVKVGNKAPLRPGDQVKIGHFTLAVGFDDPDFPATQIIDRGSLPSDRAESDDGTQVVVREVFGARASSANADLLEAFQDGAGVALELPQGLQPEFMRNLGLMLRTLVGGVHRLTTQRMRLREEAGPDQARPQLRHVNPVRAAAEESRLVAAVLKPGGDAQASPQTRIQEMIEDLAAQVAAMRTAVNTAVEQTEAKLSPAAVEKRLQASLFLDELLPMRRKARLWDLYQSTHGDAVRERSDASGDGTAEAKVDAKSGARSGIRELFNRAFTRAYEAEVARLRREKP